MDDTQGSYVAAVKMGLSQSFSYHHGRLLDLCLMEMDETRGKTKSRKAPHLEKGGEILTQNDLQSLAEMVEIEFVASFRQELHNWKALEKTKPHAFDVFLMRTPTGMAKLKGGRPSKAGRIAVCMPCKDKLEWWDGCFPCTNDTGLWPLNPPSHIRRITNLSGSARILQALAKAQSIMSSGQSQSLVAAAMKREQILRADQLSQSSVPRVGTNLNVAQEIAVQALSSFDSGFFCIQGPPGCGKTTTMVEMIMAAKTRSSVIVVAPSNAAVANVALKLYDTGLIPFGRMVVFGGNCDDSVHFLQPKFRSEKYRRFRHHYNEALRVPSGKIPSSKQKAKAKKLLCDTVQWLHLPDDQEWTASRLANHCPTIPGDSFSAMQTISALLSKADVVFCTLNSAGSDTLREALVKSMFHTLMLDEGGQCTEAEFFIATTFPAIKRIIVMGDPKQLQPTVVAPQCESNGFGDSFLGQVYTKDPSSLHLLDTQYRMDPIILRFPNSQFYRNQIKNGENVLHREPVVENPFLFEDTALNGQETKIGCSWQNKHEVSVINAMLRGDADIQRLLHPGSGAGTHVIIITPYKGQMALLEEHIHLPQGSNARLFINTVDAFQGQEGDVVILSTVRTKKPGFVDNAQRLNVALTRAKRVLRVVGELSFFQQLGESSTLRALALYALEHGLVQSSFATASPLATNIQPISNPISTKPGGVKKKKKMHHSRHKHLR